MTNSPKVCLIFICEFIFTVHIMNLVFNVCISCSTGIPTIKSGEDNTAIDEYNVMVGQGVQLPCNISIPLREDLLKEDIITLILWYKGDTLTGPVYSVDTRQSAETKHFISDDYTNRATLNLTVRPAILTINPVRAEDEGEYRCRVDFRWSRTVNTWVSLKVIVPPRKVIIKDEKLQPLELTAGPYMEDSSVKLTCEAKGARPPATVHWYRYNQLIDTSYQIIQESSRVRNQLTINNIDRNDLFAVFRCQAFNTNHTVPIEAKVVLDINFRPLNAKILSKSQPLIAGRKIDVICESSGSRPSAQITWSKDKRVIQSRDMYSDENTTKSVITLTPVPDDNGLQLVCRADNSRIANSSIEDFWTLNVHYEPRVSLVMRTNHKNNIVAEGEEVLMDCKTKANPLTNDFNWYYEQRIIKSDSLQGIHVNNETLVIKKVNPKHNGKYHCLASNTVGRGKSNDLTLTVDYAPVCKSAQKLVYGIGLGETAKILCDIDARPQQLMFYWTFNDSLIQNPRSISEGLRSSLSYTPKTLNDYGFITCSAKNVVGAQQVPCRYTIIPAGKPQTLIRCDSSNIGTSSFSITCVPGYDGGLQQSFGLEVLEEKEKKPIVNLVNNKDSSFDLSALKPNTVYMVKVFAFNVKGMSDSYEFTVRTGLSPTPPPKEYTELKEGMAEKDVVIIAILFLIIPIILLMICKTYRKFRQNLSEVCDEDMNSNDITDKSDDVSEGMDDHKCYERHNGILPQEYTQTNAKPVLHYMNDRKKCNSNQQQCYEVYEIELQDDCDPAHIGGGLPDDMSRWAPNVSTNVRMSYPLNSLRKHQNIALYYNTINTNQRANTNRRTSYTSTPV